MASGPTLTRVHPVSVGTVCRYSMCEGTMATGGGGGGGTGDKTGDFGPR